MNERETEEDKQQRLMKEEIDKYQKKVMIPLTIETNEGEFRLRPIARYLDKTINFSVTFAFYREISISEELILTIENLKEYIELECMYLLEQARYNKK